MKLLEEGRAPKTPPGAYRRLLDRTQAATTPHKETIDKRDAEVRDAALEIVEALIRRGGRSAPEPLRHDVNASRYTQEVALDELVHQQVVERVRFGPRRRHGGDWRLTDQARKYLIEEKNRTIPPELDPEAEEAAALAKKVLDNLSGEGGGMPPPVVSLRLLRTMTGGAWDPLCATLDVLENAGKITRVWRGGQLRGVRLAIPDTREAQSAAAIEVAPALVVADRRDAQRARIKGDLLGTLARSPRPLGRRALTETLHVGADVLRQLLGELQEEKFVDVCYVGTHPVGWTATQRGRIMAGLDAAPVAEPSLSSAVTPVPLFLSAREVWGTPGGEPGCAPELPPGTVFAAPLPEPAAAEPLEDRVLLALAAAHPQPLTRDVLQAQLGGSAVALRAAIDAVVAAGGATRVMNGGRSLGWVATEAALELARGCGATATPPG